MVGHLFCEPTIPGSVLGITNLGLELCDPEETLQRRIGSTEIDNDTV